MFDKPQGTDEWRANFEKQKEDFEQAFMGSNCPKAFIIMWNINKKG